MKKIFVMISIALLFIVPTVQADIIWSDPAVLFLGNPPSPSLGDGGTYLFGDEVVPIPNDSLQILLNGNGQPMLDNPLLLILGVPNSTSLTPAISGLSAGTASGPVYKDDLNAGEEAYTVLGLGDGTNNSNSFTNWSAADLAVNGISADFFGLFVYDLTNTGITGGSTIDITFGADLPNGTFAIAYGQVAKENGPNTNITAFSTPFTESGLTHKVPEPSSLWLMGMGLLGLGFFARKRK